MNASFYEAQINAILTAQLPAHVGIDELGNTIPANEYRAGQLADLSQSIRRIAWTQEAKAQAWRIAGRADQIAASLTNGVVRPLPRFESFISGGHIVPAIQ